ncbi:MAG: hypothetical protein V4772_08590 [Pseudomonadota bacterium]
MAETKPADWAQIEADYRAGVKTLRQLASEHGLTEGGIRKRAKKEDWERDLAAKIRERADALVRKDAVRSQERKTLCVPEKTIVEANAEIQVVVRRGQKADITRARKIVMSMLEELELSCGPENAAMLAEFGEIMREPDERGQDKRAELYSKLTSLSGRAKTMKDLGDSLKSLVALEREAFGIDERKAPDSQTVFNMQF